MKIQQFIKSLNNTEIGKGNTNETYIRVSKKARFIRNIFDAGNLHPKFENLKNGGVLDSIHITAEREFRINGLGSFYRNNNVHAGDEIVFERHDDGPYTKFYINLKTNNNSIIFQKHNNGFEVLNLDRLNKLKSDNLFQSGIIYNGHSGIVDVKFRQSAKKRSDSPTKTDFYSIYFNDHDIFNNSKGNEYLEISISARTKILRKVTVWQTYEFNI